MIIKGTDTKVLSQMKETLHFEACSGGDVFRIQARKARRIEFTEVHEKSLSHTILIR